MRGALYMAATPGSKYMEVHQDFIIKSSISGHSKRGLLHSLHQFRLGHPVPVIDFSRTPIASNAKVSVPRACHSEEPRAMSFAYTQRFPLITSSVNSFIQKGIGDGRWIGATGGTPRERSSRIAQERKKSDNNERT